ncbi:MAG: zf-HC2 domain-containing protein [Ruminococcus sp.]|nr:zf-HC2 domain-containing protein [Ruminococcus sp.]
MKNKKNCDLIRDLLPLYADGVCSEESRQAVAEHIAGCQKCRNMLDKMGQHISISADKDVSAVKAIRKKIRTRQIIIITVSALVILNLIPLLMLFLNMDCTMNYEKYNLAENIRIEENSEGLWLVTTNEANNYIFYLPTLSDENGNHFGYDESFDADKKIGYGITLKQKRITEISPFILSYSQEQWTKLADMENISEIFYYDDKTNTEYLLWKTE